MKKFYKTILLFVGLLTSVSLFSQSDTLFFMDFQTEDQIANMYIFPDPGASDTSWINYDEEGLDTDPGDPSNFFWAEDFEPSDTTGIDTNFVAMSQSYLVGFDTSSSNWLISPAMQIVDGNATLHWKSAAFQGPRYLDGYSIKILKGSQDFASATTTVDVVYRAAEMLGWFSTGSTLELDSFEFSNGYIHADGFTLTEYFNPGDPAAASPAHSPKLEPHSISLAQYAGETIYVAFHHDSADDYYFQFDDLLLLGTEPVSGINEPTVADLRFVTYPNPVDNFLNVMFRLSEPSDVQLEVFNQEGKRVAAKPFKKAVVGDFTEQFDLRNLVAGSYMVALTVDNQRFVKNIVRK